MNQTMRDTIRDEAIEAVCEWLEKEWIADRYTGKDFAGFVRTKFNLHNREEARNSEAMNTGNVRDMVWGEEAGRYMIIREDRNRPERRVIQIFNNGGEVSQKFLVAEITIAGYRGRRIVEAFLGEGESISRRIIMLPPSPLGDLTEGFNDRDEE